MSREDMMVNVLIKDGNRTVSWEHPNKETINHVIKSHGFKVENLVAVNFKPFDLYFTDKTKLRECGTTKYQGIDRVFFILNQDKEEKKDAG